MSRHQATSGPRCEHFMKWRRRGAGALIEGPDGEALNRDLEDIEANYSDTGGDFLVDDVDGLIVAIGALRRDGETTAEVQRMRVHPIWQRRGRGREMLRAIESRAPGLGFRTLLLDTTEQLVAARSLYASSGYVETRRAGRYGHTFVFMRKDLKAAAPAINVAFAVPSLPRQVDQSAAEAWAALSAPWQECFELSRQSFSSGVWASGACSPTQPERRSAIVAISVLAPRLQDLSRDCSDMPRSMHLPGACMVSRVGQPG
jgi:GNAT superfamily N-acetyltransferase